jgi:hypothetical protein
MGTHGVIELSRAFCSARDRNVPVLVRAGGPELVSCLDYGVRCTGWLCPLFPVPTVPPEELLEEAIQAERARKRRSIAEGRAILERAVKEGRASRARDARRKAGRRDPAAEGLPLDRSPPP